jgi:toxin FitB
VSFLLDTCILFDIPRKTDSGLLEWAAAQNQLDLHLSVLTLAEIQRGIELLPASAGERRREGLRVWLRRDLPAQFAGRILAVTEPVALEYGRLAAHGQMQGRPLPVIDGLLLATALSHAFTFVTRNVRDVEGRGVAVLNPYSGTRP